MRPVINIDELSLKSHCQGEHFEASGSNASLQVGAVKLGYGYTIVPPGKRAWPLHNHHANEEMFFVIEGEGTLRIGERQFPIRQGDFIAAPAGDASTAHQIVNTSDAPLRYIGVSTVLRPEVVEYPASGKFSVNTAAQGSDLGFRYLGDATGARPYWDGEA